MAANEMSEKTRMILTIAVAVAVNIGLGAFLYKARGEYNKLDADKKKLTAKHNDLAAIVAQKEEKELKLKELAERVKKQIDLLPEEEHIAELVRQIAKLAEDTKCENKTFAYSPGKASGAPGGVQVARDTWKTKWKADFMSWCKLMNSMEEQFPRFVAFEGFSVKPENSGVILTGTKHDVTVDIVTYRYMPPPAPKPQ